MSKRNTGVATPARVEGGYGAGGQTMVWSVHKTRRKAREIERNLTKLFALIERRRAEVSASGTGLFAGASYDGRTLPAWAQGARVRRAGLLQHEVELTSWRGH